MPARIFCSAALLFGGGCSDDLVIEGAATAGDTLSGGDSSLSDVWIAELGGGPDIPDVAADLFTVADSTADIAADGVVDLDLDATDVDVIANGCPTGCPSGYFCYGGDNAPGQCTPGPAYACALCTSDATCLGGKCSSLQNESGTCLIPCLGSGAESSCPKGFSCNADGDLHICQPVNGSCTCGPNNDGKVRACQSGSGLGVCGGVQTCTLTKGWSKCTAGVSSKETCDGLDNDCNGQTDEGTAGGVCGPLNAPDCKGKFMCNGAAGLTCDATPASLEVCDGKDNNCDGQTDENYKLNGLYLQFEHCGSCDTSCGGKLANGTAKCGVINGKALCLIDTCNPGYFASGDQCSPAGILSCQPCVDSTDCAGGLCIDATCRPPCSLTDAKWPTCPDNYACSAIINGTYCAPVSGTCSCTVATDGKQQNCVSSNQYGTCNGKSTCDPKVGWVNCSAANPSEEICNGSDDDCDGKTDEGTAGGKCVNSNANGNCSGKFKCNGVAGLACDAPSATTETCDGKDDNCNGETDEGWKSAVSGLYNTINACGSCGILCAVPGPHALPSCAGGACATTCDVGWIDMNSNVGDGCECQFLSDLDEPDGVDQNCDGIDGDISKAIFVAKTGADSNPGSISLPVATLTKALQLATEQNKRDIYVGGGVYTGSIDLFVGVSLYGGYMPGFFSRDTVSYQSAIVGTAFGPGPVAAVRAVAITGGAAVQKTRLDGFVVLGASAKTAGDTSYGIYVAKCDDTVQILNCTIVAGDGAAGLAGVTGQNGSIGSSGTFGKKAKDIGHEFCSIDDASTGGIGGANVCGLPDNATISVDGGSGGTAICAQYDEDSPPPLCPTSPILQTPLAIETGKPGSGTAPGAGGSPGADSYIDSNKTVLTQCKSDKVACNTCFVPVKPRTGEDGLPGKGGANGAAGLGCVQTLGAIVGDVWQSLPGSVGSLGKAGSGGGGGGAAGGVEVHDCVKAGAQNPDIGGSGGGGGAGGCGGTGGGGGGSGGGSFALFIRIVDGAALPIVVGNTVSSGTGGAGATGGPAGSGGAGGQGGKGGASGEETTATFCTSKGGTGGVGGSAGHGGGGGGGCGGPSAQLVLVGAPLGSGVDLQKLNQFKTLGAGGKAGLGGPSIGEFGLVGKVGLAKAILEF